MQRADDWRVIQALQSASQAQAAGQPQEAERILADAQSWAPGHPLVLSEIARRRLSQGDAAQARAMLEQALAHAPTDVTLLMSLADVAHVEQRPVEELAVLTRLLPHEPGNFHALIRAGALQEAAGDGRAAAATYRSALQAIPRGLPLNMRPQLDRARAVIEANDRALEGFLGDYLGPLRARHADPSLRRFDKSLDTLLQKRKVYRSQPSFMYVPELPTIEFYERGDFPWLDQLEAATDDIRAELINVLADGPAALEPYVAMQGVTGPLWRELNHSRRWGVFYLWRAGEAMVENLARCPRTAKALEAWPRCDLQGTAPTAVFSILDAKTRIPPHVGVNNARLIVHLPLIVPPGCGFRVGAEHRQWAPGKAFVFDDTIEHEAWNDSDQARAVLILDVWNPHISLAEREMVSALTAGVSEYYGPLPPYLVGQPV